MFQIFLNAIDMFITPHSLDSGRNGQSGRITHADQRKSSIPHTS